MHGAEETLEAALKGLSAAREALVREVTAICQIPAPTFAEALRGEHVARRMRQIGLADVQTDEIGNVTGEVRGSRARPRLLVAAHIDTVFPDETDVRVHRRNGRLFAPGVGDNAASVGCMLQVAASLRPAAIAGSVVFASPVGEEGNGDLRGMRELIDRYRGKVDGVVAIDGKLGGVVTRAVGSCRYRLRVNGPGGHSWGDFGRPSATHVLARIVARLADLEVPTDPRSTFNVGLLSGGTSINTIAAEAVAEVDLRSTDAAALAALDRRAREAIAAVELPDGTRLDIEKIGARPAGQTSETNWIILAARKALLALGVEPILTSSSTDANIPMAAGIPAICFGVYRGGGAHTLSEHVEIGSLTLGARALLVLLCEALSSAPRKKAASSR